MEGFFLGLIKQQWQSALRWVLTTLGTALVAKGVVSPEHWGNLSPLIETAVGALVALGSGAWSILSNKPSVILSTADDLRGQGHTISKGKLK